MGVGEGEMGVGEGEGNVTKISYMYILLVNSLVTCVMLHIPVCFHLIHEQFVKDAPLTESSCNDKTFLKAFEHVS